MDVTVKQLRAFAAVATDLSFTDAARRLHISQPALSVQIAQLERIVGAPLLQRTSRRVCLTDAGRGFFADTERLLGDLELATERARRTHQGATGVVRIAYTASVAYQALPLLLDQLAVTHPTLAVTSTQLWSVDAIEAVKLGTADLALVREFAGREGLSTEVIRREPLAAFMSVSHPLAAGGSISVADLDGHAIAVVPTRLASGFHDLLIALCQARGFKPLTVELDSIENREPLLAHLARHPDVLFVGPVSMSSVSWQGVVQVPISDADARMRLDLVWPHDASAAVQLARDAAREVADRAGWLARDVNASGV